MTNSLHHRGLTLALLLAAPLYSACGPQAAGPNPNAHTAVSPLTHRAFPIDQGVHALDCAACHGTFDSFKQFDCLGCHVKPPTAAVHTTTPGYAYANTSCLECHRDPAAHPYDHKGITTCGGCHDTGAFYAALPVEGFTHPAIPTDTATGRPSDCSRCHVTTTWLNAPVPVGLVSDPAVAVAVNALVARFSGTTLTALSSQAELLPMGMDHASTAVDVAGLACSACHADARSAVYYPGRLHSSLATRSQPAPLTCAGCHAGSAPQGLVGPIETPPARTPPSGAMKHDAVAWSAAGAPTSTRLVTADCGVCHLGPTSTLDATWATGKAGTSPARYHASLTAATIAQPASCLDCHANSRPVPALSSTTAVLPAGLTFDHAAAGANGDCAACHAASSPAWSGGRLHRAGSANPASCLPCHEGQRPFSTAGWTSTSYATSPFDYGTNAAGVTHGDGQDCAACHAGPGTGGAWGGRQSFVGGRFAHGPASVASSTCIACHMSQRPDLVLGPAQAAALLGGFDHAVTGTGDCIGCHQATTRAGTYVNYFGPGGVLPGGDWKGAAGYPGNTLVAAPGQFVTVTEISLVRAPAGGPVTGTTSIQETLYNAMLHSSAQVPPAVSPGPAGAPDAATCWHCHLHDAAGKVTTFANGLFHASLSGYRATPAGPVAPLPQPTTGCTDCHAQMRPTGIVELSGSDLQPMDHAALFTATVTIGGQAVSGVAGLDCSTCHKVPGTNWRDGTFHARIGSAVPADCVACHYPLMADRARSDVASGTRFTMSHGSPQLGTQACATCHASALAGSTATPYLATAWKTGAYHGSVPAQPTACLDCHAASEPAPNRSTQSSWTYVLAAGGTGSNSPQWMNHGAAPVAGADCSKCHLADARTSGSAWSRSTEFHVAVTSPGSCQVCHGLTNGGGTVAGTNNNLPAGLTSSTTVSTASANSLTGVPAGTRDQITHTDVNASSHDCGFCHTQAGRSAAAGVQGAEWAKARFHASFSAATPLTVNGTTGRCSNCHLNVKPGPSYTGQDHGPFTATSTQDCSSCHAWPGSGTAAAPNWRGASGGVPPFITVGGFAIPVPPASTATTQAGITSLPHPTLAATTTCASCHAGGVGGKQAKGYDHASTLINPACSSCHEAGSNLVGTAWNRATAQASGAGDTRPFTLTSIVAHKGGAGGGSCNLTVAKHFYPVQCGQCHAAPKGISTATTGTAYTAAWYFPHTESKMTNPGTCNLCHVGQGCSK
jgi:hypothetical protein